MIERAAKQARVDGGARSVTPDGRLDGVRLVSRPARKPLGGVADLRLLGVAEMEQLESSGEMDLGAAKQIEVAGQVHDEIFLTRAAAYLKDGCLLTGSQVVSVSSLAARGRPSSSQ